jgi:hypothetical protein
MAERQYDITPGRRQENVSSQTVVADIGGSVVRVIADGENAGTRENAIWALKAIAVQLARDPWPPGGDYVFVNAEAATLVAAMTTAPSNDRKALIDTLIGSLKSAGVWVLLDVLYVLAAHHEQAARLNWKNPGGFVAAGVNSPTFTVDRGFAGNGVDSFVTLNWGPTSGVNFTQNSATFGIWDRTTTASAASVAGSGTSTAVTINPRSTTGDGFVYRVNQSTAETQGATLNASGLSAASRSGSTATQGYKNGVSIGSPGAIASQAISAVGLNLGRTNTSSFSSHEFAATFAGANLNGTQHSDLHTALLAYMQAVGAA